MSQFQLFPPPTPEVKISKNPFRKGNKKPLNTQPQSPIPLEDLDNTAKAESALFQIIEDTNGGQRPSKSRVPKSKSPASIPSSTQDVKSLETLRSLSRQNDRPARPSDDTGSTTLVGSSSSVRSHSFSQEPLQESSSPVIPMRSMFPRYNPDVPLSQQQYYPNSSNETSRAKPRGLTLSPAPEIDDSLGPKTVPASIMNFPTGVLDSVEMQYSSAAELKGLWEAANGQRPQNPIGTYNLCMARTNTAKFTFGDPESPFYTLETYSTNELAISRADPSKPNNNVPIMMLSLENRRRREPPNDGLVTSLFSRLAAMLAIEQAEELSRQHQLSPAEAIEVEGNALQRAATQESCRLSWNHQQRLYELQHQSSMSKQPQQRQPLVGAAGVPLSPMRAKSTGTLHIAVSIPCSEKRRQPPTIIATTPISSNATEAASLAATPRTSTLPLTDLDEPLASLDLGTMTLSISAAAIVATIPSLYAIDSLVAAMLAVAVSDEATNPVLADMELYSNQGPSASTIPRFQGKLVTTLAEREDDAQADELVSRVKSKDAETSPETKKGLFQWCSRTKSKKTKNKKIVIEEFDLEKYGRYGHSSSREGEKLPSATRGVLRILFWGLDLVVRGLTLIVKVIAWILVSMTRCVTSEKF
ncbi:hypothetical protein ASPWEDRAFT_25260 [Aspergillus wentii DTO 134E9]|uniref:Uncharacterized protein n=1 Tax=Aspergillus wentii DTO 134E9 TaxID=1073089 RepID=A0A1L9RX06_ASPWE|nr:uncharacterized protein ASPWEDRAFT_25260 [Aspergillus wentii DTO 134E9]KAI9928894.1 hypothetical protein MW887_001287 [Aspergillus wentii]OJJ39423.1 hypothetical protein ASPWEDRAFT_25260 [Aspergillus wentii DTO 134E9]